MAEKDLRSNSTEYNKATQAKQLTHEKLNTIQNYSHILRAFKEGRAKDISDEPGVDYKQNAIVIGSGPSLDLAIPCLQKWKGAIFCTTSHAATLMYYGIEPTHLVVLDPFCCWDEIKGIDWSKTKTKLITHPGAWPDLLENWPNEVLLYVQDSGRRDSFYASVQKVMYSQREFPEGATMRDPVFRYLIRTEVIIFACSPPAQVFFAAKLQYRSTFLVGVDFGFPYGKERFTGYSVSGADDEGNPTWEKKEYPFVDDKSERIVYSDNNIPSEVVHLYYKKNLICAWRLSLQTLYTTDKGTITEIPFARLAKVVKNNGFGFPKQRKEFITKASEKYLASMGTYVIDTGTKGISFIETVEGLGVVYNYIDYLNRQYYCEACKTQQEAHDNKNHAGEGCSICKQPEAKLKKLYDIDVKANLARVSRLSIYDEKAAEYEQKMKKVGKKLGVGDEQQRKS